jgi:hypothetical protein
MLLMLQGVIFDIAKNCNLCAILLEWKMARRVSLRDVVLYTLHNIILSILKESSVHFDVADNRVVLPI